MIEDADRVVDRYQRGWTVQPCRTWPDLGDGRRWTLATLDARRGPLRPVVPHHPVDARIIGDVLVDARDRAVASLMVALFQVAKSCFAADGHDRRMVAGHPESWGSAMLPCFAWEVGVRAAGSLVDGTAVAVVTAKIQDWIFGRRGYVEVAENLMHIVGGVVVVAGGWERVSDPWVRAHPLAGEMAGFVLTKVGTSA